MVLWAGRPESGSGRRLWGGMGLSMGIFRNTGNSPIWKMRTAAASAMKWGEVGCPFV